ncbi:unnamed protein product, partial [Ixodes persulcatus]
MLDIHPTWVPEKEECTGRRTDPARIAEVVEKKAHESGGGSHTGQLVFVHATRKSVPAGRRRSKQQQQRGGDVESNTSSGGRRLVPGMRSPGLRHGGGNLAFPSAATESVETRRCGAEPTALPVAPSRGRRRERGRSLSPVALVP